MTTKAELHHLVDLLPDGELPAVQWFLNYAYTHRESVLQTWLQSRSEASLEVTKLPPLTAHDLLHSEVVGLWADRADIKDSLEYARQLRHQAEHRKLREED
jgi:hypothetical protein